MPPWRRQGEGEAWGEGGLRVKGVPPPWRREGDASEPSQTACQTGKAVIWDGPLSES